jgi:peptide alpha-N-acetyltransferase
MNYELKQYKKGLKAADTVLKKFPNHGGQSVITSQ